MSSIKSDTTIANSPAGKKNLQAAAIDIIRKNNTNNNYGYVYVIGKIWTLLFKLGYKRIFRQDVYIAPWVQLEQAIKKTGEVGDLINLG